jgi:hypothetical protein
VSPRTPATLLFDIRNHLPSRPLKGWSFPTVDPVEPDAYRIDAPDFFILANLLRSRTAHTLVVTIVPYEGDGPVTDEDANRVLRRFRCHGPFREDAEPGGERRIRLFYARAKLGSPTRWPQVQRAEDSFDVRNHLPHPPPKGWSLPIVDPKEPTGYRIDAQDFIVLSKLERGHGGRGWELFVGVMRFQGTEPITDEEAQSVLRHFRAHGPFEDRSVGIGHPMPWIRAYFAPANAVDVASLAEVQKDGSKGMRSIPPRGWLIVERRKGAGVVFALEKSSLRMWATWVAEEDFRLVIWHEGRTKPASDEEVERALAQNKGASEVYEEIPAAPDDPEGARAFRRRALETAIN